MTKFQTLANEWIRERPFLKELGQFHLLIDSILENVQVERGELETLNSAKEEFQRGIPLFKCESFVEPFTDAACQAFEALSGLAEYEEVPQPFRENCLILQKALLKNNDLAATVIKSLIQNDLQALSAAADEFDLNAGMVRFLGWTAIAHAIKPYLPEIMEWEEKQGWKKEYCPTCGALPNMAQLKRSNKGRRRHLVCGCCKTTWVYKRLVCPYCHNEDQEQMVIMEIDEEEDIRVDVCKSCNGYIKVYTSQGEEEITLADWSTIHLDLLVKEKGYLKMGTHLLEV